MVGKNKPNSRIKTTIKQIGFGDVLEIELKKGEEFHALPGSFIVSQGNVEVVNSKKATALPSLLSLFGGAPTFTPDVVRASEDSLVVLGMPIQCELAEVAVEGKELLLGDGAYLAHVGDISLVSDLWASHKGLAKKLEKVGGNFLVVRGKGKLFVAGITGIQRVSLSEGEFIMLNRSNFLACPADANIEVISMGKGISKIFGDKGYVIKVWGPAEVYYRLGSQMSLAERLASYYRV